MLLSLDLAGDGMSVTSLGLVLVVLAVVGLVVAGTFRSRQRADPPRATAPTRERPRYEAGKSRLTVMSEIAGIVGAVIAIIGLLVR
jgi:hypothetical protein